jgi:hypothetical protein
MLPNSFFYGAADCANTGRLPTDQNTFNTIPSAFPCFLVVENVHLPGIPWHRRNFRCYCITAGVALSEFQK